MSKKKVFRIYLFLTDACNRACSYCYQVGKKVDMTKRISVKEAVEYTNQFDLEQLSVFGGEPMLEMADIEYILANSNAHLIGITTNGDMLTDEIIDKWTSINKNIDIQYSIHDVTKIKEYKSDLVFYHLTVGKNDIGILKKVALSGLHKRRNIWIAFDRHIEGIDLVAEMEKIKAENEYLFWEIVDMFTPAVVVGVNCHGPAGDKILINCVSGDVYNCAGMMYKGLNKLGNIADEVKSDWSVKNVYNCISECQNEYCMICRCVGMQSDETRDIMCRFYKWLKSTKEEEKLYEI